MNDYYQLNLVEAPAAYPVTLEQARNYIKAISTVTTDDTLIEDVLIPAATRKVENYINRKLITQTWKMTLDSQPDPIDLPFGYLQEVDSIVTISDAGVETDESTKVHTRTGDGGQIYLKVGQTYATTTRTHELMEIEFVVGYGDDGDELLPDYADIVTAIYQMISALYYNRDATIDDVPNAKLLLEPYIIYAFKP